MAIEIDLRPWSEEDAPLLQRLMGDPAMTEFLGGPETSEKIAKRHRRYVNGTQGVEQVYAIVAGPERTAVGSIGYWEHVEGEVTDWETGWSVLPEWQGRGIAAAATAALLAIVRELGSHRWVYAYPSIENGASNALCRRAGFQFLEERASEYPPGNPVQLNVWRFDLSGPSVIR